MKKINELADKFAQYAAPPEEGPLIDYPPMLLDMGTAQSPNMANLIENVKAIHEHLLSISKKVQT